MKIKTVIPFNIGTQWMMRSIRTLLGEHNFVVAGGYARDLAFGFKPKDCDVFVKGVKDFDTYERLVRRITDILEVSNTRYTIHESSGQDDTDFTQRVWGCLKFSIGSTAIDILPLLDDSECPSLTFDFNINQFAIHDNSIVFTGEQHPSEHGLIQLRSCPVAREQYIRDKWEAICRK